MTTPATRQRGAGSGQGAYQHRTWREEMAESVKILNTILDQLEIIKASLQQVGAGETQLQLVDRMYALIHDLAAGAVKFTGQVNDRYMPHGQAIASVGGTREVADDKHYNTTG
jgi:hypothetical protein